MKKKREEMRMRAFDSTEYAQGGAQDCRIKKLLDELDAKDQRELELLKSQGVNREGDALLTAMRDERLKTDRGLKKQNENEQSDSYLPALKDKNGKIDVTSFLPKAQALITMAPAEKQDLFSRLKYVQKKVYQHKDQDPIEINKKVTAGDLNPCEAHAKIAAIEQAQVSSRRVAPQITESQALVDRERKTKSVQRAAIKAAFSGMNQLENQQFEELFKQTMK